VPVQKVSAAVPWSERDISCCQVVSGAHSETRTQAHGATHGQSCHEDGGVERYNEGDEAQTDHDEPVLALWLPWRWSSQVSVLRARQAVVHLQSPPYSPFCPPATAAAAAAVFSLKSGTAEAGLGL
jgi:hypothetical protein